MAAGQAGAPPLAAPQQWRDLGGGSYVLPGGGTLRLNIGLVVGAERAMVIDTGTGPRHAAQILAAVRTVTALPLVVVNTHAHWDHFFGNAVFRADGVSEFWAHANAAREIRESGDLQRAAVAESEPEMAAASGEHTELVVPAALVREQPVLVDLGGMTVSLFSLGRGHTDGDLMVGTPTALFSGDVVEEGAYPSFEDSYPSEWANVLRQLVGLRHRYDYLVPGHGNLASHELVESMAGTMTAAVQQGRNATADMPDLATKAIPMLPYGPEESRWFLKRLKETR
jgi:glyoxylase-like metal-dependent hydrolase (beta-lactamase superfamily II)